MVWHKWIPCCGILGVMDGKLSVIFHEIHRIKPCPHCTQITQLNNIYQYTKDSICYKNRAPYSYKYYIQQIYLIVIEWIIFKHLSLFCIVFQKYGIHLCKPHILNSPNQRQFNYAVINIWTPFPHFKGASIEIWEWISNFTPHFIGYVITYPCWYWS